MYEKILEYLVLKNVLNIEQVDSINLKIHEKGFELYVLVEEGYLDETTYLSLLSEYMNLKLINLTKIPINMEIIKSFPKEIMQEHCILPLYFLNTELCIVTNNPFNIEIFNDLKFLIQKEIKINLASKIQIMQKMSLYYEKLTVEKALNNVNKEINNYNDTNNSDKNQINVKDAPTVQLLDLILSNAILKRASDIHIEPFEDEVFIRYRIDGILFIVMHIPKALYGVISTRLKIVSNMDISEKRIPQDGKTIFTFSNKQYDFRVSSLPTIYGEKFVIRVMNNYQCDFTLDSFKYDEKKQLLSILSNNHGMILITGPTGSGKTTTLYSMLNELKHQNKSIITIEDPVEYNFKGINQVNVNNKSGLTFAAGLRSMLRQDPDILMIGEIRDEETAQIAVRAAITGRLVFSTLHTNDAPSSILRLLDMGVPSYLLADAIVVVIAQRLVKKICIKCKTNYIPSKEQIDQLEINHDDILYKGIGCDECNYTGYFGRIAVLELINIKCSHRKLIQDRVCLDDFRQHCLDNNMVNLRDNCLTLVMKGETTYEEWLKVAYSN